MKDFNYWKKLHESEQLGEFSSDSIGLLWLKTKSIVRKELITEFVEQNKIALKEAALGEFIQNFVSGPQMWMAEFCVLGSPYSQNGLVKK